MTDSIQTYKGIIEYVKKMTGMKAIIDSAGEDAPYNGAQKFMKELIIKDTMEEYLAVSKS